MGLLGYYISPPSFLQVVRSAWIRGVPNVPQSLICLKQDSLSFNKQVFGNTIHRKRVLQAQIKGLQQWLEFVNFTSLQLLEKELQDEYSMVLMQKELLWYQKSRESWVEFGDRNMNFFHVQTLVKMAHISF